MTDMMELMQVLCALDGVSGYEDGVREAIEGMIAPHVEEMTVDAMGSLIALKKGARAPARRLMVCAHTDEVGMLVFRITDEGLLKFVPVGTLDPRVLLGQRVRIGERRLPGVVAVKAIHLTSEAEKKISPPIDALYIDIGARSKKEAASHVRVGDPVMFDNEPGAFGEGRFRGKAIDDRLGCAVMVSLIRGNIPFDTWFAFSTCEEVGLRGASALTERVRPDMTLVLEGTSAGDMPSVRPDLRATRQGAGAVVSVADGGTVYNREVIEKMTCAADAAGIPWQPRSGMGGRTDSGSIHVRAGGSLTFGVSAPTRYIHSANNVVYMPDAKAVLDLTALFIATMGE
ncbi:M42 family peptidase [Synergistaceae bacterium OttesenSCG-928-I11]|nr:M42 family peptidase [Synergistaceae bacterium OttesenSCG-928-I11]